MFCVALKKLVNMPIILTDDLLCVLSMDTWWNFVQELKKMPIISLLTGTAMLWSKGQQ